MTCMMSGLNVVPLVRCSINDVFSSSTFATRLCESTRTPKRPNRMKLGWRQFDYAKCDCIKELKPFQRDFQDRTYEIANLSICSRTRGRLVS